MVPERFLSVRLLRVFFTIWYFLHSVYSEYESLKQRNESPFHFYVVKVANFSSNLLRF